MIQGRKERGSVILVRKRKREEKTDGGVARDGIDRAGEERGVLEDALSSWFVGGVVALRCGRSVGCLAGTVDEEAVLDTRLASTSTSSCKEHREVGVVGQTVEWDVRGHWLLLLHVQSPQLGLQFYSLHITRIA